jgi:hypothetical protein
VLKKKKKKKKKSKERMFRAIKINDRSHDTAPVAFEKTRNLFSGYVAYPFPKERSSRRPEWRVGPVLR